MKQTAIAFFLICIIASCKRDISEPSLQPINIIVKAGYEKSNTGYGFPLAGISIALKNISTGKTINQKSDDTGLGIFNGMMPGLYEIQGTFKMSKEDYENRTGDVTTQDSVSFNGILNGITLNAATNNTLNLTISPGKIGDWVIKQVYYEGSGPNAALFRDQFIEIYNNSNDTLYADSLYFGVAAGAGTYNRNIDLSSGNYITNESDILYKQFDWSKSVGMPAGIKSEATGKYIYIDALYRIPGSGIDHPVAPGKSIVIAATAQNHKAGYVDRDNHPIPVKDPSKTIDLSNADFEVYLANIISNPFTSDVDNTNIPNVIVNVNNARDLILDLTGREAYFIFKSDKPFPAFGEPASPQSYPRYPDPTVTADQISGATPTYYQVPNDLLIDAVQVQNTIINNRHPRRLVAALDGGVTFAPGGLYSSQSIVRKILKTVDGRKIYTDTNNSTNDFEYRVVTQPDTFDN
ncbi:DUF4876 domain-containing protein [Niabella aurantiaca]|uniref:DUF4876 domain-containing protein n=1 Tax=Niabella aurantiaca TaxID=379900 RepID=UPI00035F6855|nr:DUF4876 domain-containing protein [Niabella aurantiaca]